MGMSIDDSLKGFSEIVRLARSAGKMVRGYVVTAFGCPYEGAIPVERVRTIIRAYADMGVREISPGDTTGMANPREEADDSVEPVDTQYSRLRRCVY